MIQQHLDDISRFDAVVRSHRFAVHPHIACVRCRLNTVGLTLQDARSLLLSHRLTVGAVSYDEPEEEGVPQYVYRQIPNAGEKLLEGEMVSLKLSSDVEKAVYQPQTNESEEDNWF